MSAMLKAKPKFDLPPRKKDVLHPRPEMGDQADQVNQAFAITFERFERAIEELAKR